MNHSEGLQPQAMQVSYIRGAVTASLPSLILFCMIRMLEMQPWSKGEGAKNMMLDILFLSTFFTGLGANGCLVGYRTLIKGRYLTIGKQASPVELIEAGKALATVSWSCAVLVLWLGMQPLVHATLHGTGRTA
ncbi:hypothetical protein CC2G_006314 [Coprinopsis cinerea AmutBmut pab1-1]|nr:hypothetical protein CC2G_006314 [Coprinopsis cinerea AmutBmut pab1-1]